MAGANNGRRSPFVIYIVEGDISNYQADAIVNLAKENLQLKESGITRPLLDVAGGGLQNEIDRKYPKGVEPGAVVVTGGYGLKCSNVYHSALPQWPFGETDSAYEIQVLTQLVYISLNRAHEDGVTCMAFPPLGTGFHGYPVEVSAQSMFYGMSLFQSEHVTTSIENISIIINTHVNDWRHVKQAFLRALTLHVELPTDREIANFRSSFKSAADLSSTVIRPKTKTSCTKTLLCGHPCQGYKDEKRCLPCIQKRCNPELPQHAGDECTICYTEELAEAPVVMLKCGHLFHLHCIQRLIQNKWVGPRITFNFCLCPICKTRIEHQKLHPLLRSIVVIEDDVKRKALIRLQYEGLDKADDVIKRGSPYYRNPTGYAMSRYTYYLCYRCKKAYFGGTVECAQQVEAGEFKEEELVCGGCSGVSREKVCDKHGADFIDYKCRYCCSMAIFYCLGKYHFCQVCHDNFGTVTRMRNCPPCPTGPLGQALPGNKCPLNGNHAPTGEECALGCGVCANVDTF